MYPCAHLPRRRLEFCEHISLAPDVDHLRTFHPFKRDSSVSQLSILPTLIRPNANPNSSFFTHRRFNSPLRQPQQQLPLRPIRNEARNAEPAHRAVSILSFPSRAHTQCIPHQLLSIRRRKLLRLVRQSSDQLHLRQWARGRGREGASAKARELGAEGLHFRRRGAWLRWNWC